MRHSAVGQHVSTDPDWPTACPRCGRATLDYRFEMSGGDRYDCGNCQTIVVVRDVMKRSGGWKRLISLHWTPPGGWLRIATDTPRGWDAIKKIIEEGKFHR